MKTVLIVEDEPSNRKVFCELLTMRGYGILEATTSKEAIRASEISSAPIDLILCDLNLAEMAGTKLAQEIRKLHGNAAVLIVSGTPRDDWSKNAVDDFLKLPPERTDFLEKPFVPAALQSKIEALLREPSRMSVRRAP